MRPSFRFPLALALAALALPAAARAQGAPLPTGRAVIDKFISAIGGRDAVMRQTGRHAKGHFEIPAQGVAGDLEVYAAPPNKLSVTVVITGLGEIRTGFDGTVGWSLNPAMGPMVLDGLQLEQMRQQADFYTALYPPEMIAELETAGEETFEEHPSYKVRVKTTWGEEFFEFFDQSSGLQLGSRRTVASPMGDIEATTVFSDWREVEGVKVPFRTVQRTMGIEQVFTITEMTPSAVPDSVFALPAQIETMVKQ